MPRSAIELVPFPLDHAPLLWAWLNEFPDANFDDSGPRTCEELRAGLSARMASETIWEVIHAGAPVGAIAHATAAGETWFRGIVFARWVHGTGIARQAVGLCLERLFASGVPAIAARYFADNVRIRRFLQSLGGGPAAPSGSTIRTGKAIAVEQLQIPAADFARLTR